MYHDAGNCEILFSGSFALCGIRIVIMSRELQPEEELRTSNLHCIVFALYCMYIVGARSPESITIMYPGPTWDMRSEFEGPEATIAISMSRKGVIAQAHDPPSQRSWP